MIQSSSLVSQSAWRLLFSRSMSVTSASASSFFANVEMAPKDPILGITERYLADTNPEKINVGVVGAELWRCGRARGHKPVCRSITASSC
jgi:hypothetical protein